jgi:hypothetical protein
VCFTRLAVHWAAIARCISSDFVTCLVESEILSRAYHDVSCTAICAPSAFTRPTRARGWHTPPLRCEREHHPQTPRTARSSLLVYPPQVQLPRSIQQLHNPFPGLQRPLCEPHQRSLWYIHNTHTHNTNTNRSRVHCIRVSQRTTQRPNDCAHTSHHSGSSNHPSAAVKSCFTVHSSSHPFVRPLDDPVRANSACEHPDSHSANIF